MSSIVLVVVLVFPGYLAVAIRDFFIGRRGKPSADRILEASLYTLFAAALLVVCGIDLFVGTQLEGGSLHDLLAGPTFESLLYLGATSTLMAGLWTLISRRRFVRGVMRRLLARTFTHDVLYDQYLDVLNAMRQAGHTGSAIAVVKLKSGAYIKGTVSSLSDTATDAGMFLTNTDFYDSSLTKHVPMDVFLRDGAQRAIHGAGVYFRRTEVESVWLGIDEKRYVGFRAALENVRSPVPASTPSPQVAPPAKSPD